MRTFSFFLLFFVLIASWVNAATIYGSVYDLQLNKQTDVKVEINTSPKQVYVSKNGTYAFNVPLGSYKIKAGYYLDELDLYAEENIYIENEGTFIFDIVLFPSFKQEDELLNEGGINVIGPFDEKKIIWPYALVVLGIIFVIFLVYLALKKRTKKEQKIELGLENIIKMIKEEGGRITQKDIRKKIPLSEAKVSLMISELESKGVIKKIKKGRGNIIILEKK